MSAERRPALAAAAALVAVLVLGVAIFAGLRSLDTVGGDADATGSAPAVPGASIVEPTEGVPAGSDEDTDCVATGRGRLRLDLGVQVATDDPGRPLLDRRRVDALVALAQQAGADVISTDIGWEDVLPSADAQPQWQGVDLFLDAVGSRGLRVRVVLTGSPGWAVSGSDPDTEWRPPRTRAELNRWREFVRLTMQHLDGRADYVQVWTEPNQPEYFTGGVDPAAYARLLRATAPVVRRWAPQARLVTGGLAGNDLGYLSVLYEELPAGERLFDLVGVHPFSGALAPDAVDPSAVVEGPFGPVDQTFTGFRAVHQLMTEQGDGDVPLYLAKFGYSTEPQDLTPGTQDAERARRLPRALDLAACSPYVEAMGWYYLHPTPWDDASWTLVDRGLQPSRTFRALRTWSETSP